MDFMGNFTASDKFTNTQAFMALGVSGEFFQNHLPFLFREAENIILKFAVFSFFFCNRETETTLNPPSLVQKIAEGRGWFRELPWWKNIQNFVFLKQILNLSVSYKD